MNVRELTTVLGSMKLQDLLNTTTKLGLEAIANDRELSIQIQTQLISFGLLDPPSDGNFGTISAAALKNFQSNINVEVNLVSAITAKALLETNPQVLKPKLQLENNLASRIIKYMLAKSYFVTTNPQEFNIVYVEGMNEDGSLNSDAPNAFNDQRLVIRFSDGVPSIVGCWQATTEPGDHYTCHPMNRDGAARIQFNQYRAWQVGIHGNAEPHEALIQCGQITVCRDFNQDFKRTGDKLHTGLFGMNQHWGYDFPANNVHNASAGCLVGRTRKGHREFMKLAKSDRRYLANKNYIFFTTIIAGDDLVSFAQLS